MTPKHLVMAVAWGYHEDIYEVFLGSLRRTGYTGAIKLLSLPGRTSANATAVAMHWGAEVVPLSNITFNRRTGKPAWLSGERFRTYDDLCAGGGFELCLAADFRDVFFQTNPFHAVRHMPLADLWLPLESRIIGTCIHNSHMIRRCFGHTALQSISNETVACSGVILGGPRGFAALRILARLVRRCPYDKMSDQASLNLALYSGMLRRAPGFNPRLRIETQTNGFGFTNTIGVVKGVEKVAAFERNRMRDGVVLSEDGTPSPIVHQYDRALKSTGPRGVFGRTRTALRLRAVEEAIGMRADSRWLALGA